MRIAKHSRRARGMQPVGINQRMSLGRDDLDVLHADAPQFAGHVIRPRRASDLWSGRVLTAGMGRRFFRSFRKRWWFWGAKGSAGDCIEGLSQKLPKLWL